MDKTVLKYLYELLLREKARVQYQSSNHEAYWELPKINKAIKAIEIGLGLEDESKH